MQTLDPMSFELIWNAFLSVKGIVTVLLPAEFKPRVGKSEKPRAW